MFISPASRNVVELITQNTNITLLVLKVFWSILSPNDHYYCNCHNNIFKASVFLPKYPLFVHEFDCKLNWTSLLSPCSILGWQPPSSSSQSSSSTCWLSLSSSLSSLSWSLSSPGAPGPGWRCRGWVGCCRGWTCWRRAPAWWTWSTW